MPRAGKQIPPPPLINHPNSRVIVRTCGGGPARNNLFFHWSKQRFILMLAHCRQRDACSCRITYLRRLIAFDLLDPHESLTSCKLHTFNDTFRTMLLPQIKNKFYSWSVAAALLLRFSA